MKIFVIIAKTKIVLEIIEKGNEFDAMDYWQGIFGDKVIIQAERI